MKPLLLVLVYLSPEHRELVSQDFEMIYAPNELLGADRRNGEAQIALHGDAIRVVLTNGTNGLTAAEIDALPKLEIICTVGVGFENVALDNWVRAGGRVLLMWARRDADGRQHIDLQPAWPGWPGADDTDTAARYMQWVGERLQAAPEQYLWVHRRFKTRPPGEPPVYR